MDWVIEAERRGAGEFVLNCMNQDGVRQGYDTKQLALVRENCTVPLIASGGAGALEHFATVFDVAHVDGARGGKHYWQGPNLPQSTSDSFSSVPEADEFKAAMIDEKLREGYERLPGEASIKAFEE